MLALLRLVVGLGLVLGVIYASLWFYALARRRGQLEEAWHLQDKPGTREDFVAGELALYRRRLRSRLLLWVVAAPLTGVGALLYASEFM